ncbi:LacI family DNA-binding transcriptional regulator [Pseudonocardia acaciae]|uniref:LacI family DNA-binding transcriptional regulator n=1 Tax=Pseudonocardia acaciae TaxID=551276 RepID=UPI00068766A1|nr:LacI family DNA-binding transcriptional regulator [Pseudonocardia acaciae]
MSRRRSSSPRVSPGIRDVAAAAGVSVTTVSDSLSGKGRISEATRLRVRAVADSLGYRPSALAQGLRAGRSRLLGLVVTKYGPTPWTFTRVPYFASVVDAAIAAALDNGYALVVLPTGRQLEDLLAYPFDGLFVVDPLRDDPLVAEARRRGLHVIADRANATTPDHLWVDFDHDRAIALMCDHLRGDRHRSPVLLASDGEDSYTDACAAAYARWCARTGATPRIVRAGHTDDDACSCVRGLLRAPDRPDAIFGIEDLHLPALRREARDARLRVPEDIALGCFSEESVGGSPVARLTVNPAALAANAVALLVAAIENRPPGAEPRTVDCELLTPVMHSPSG